MKLRLLTVLVVGLALGADTPREDEAAKDLKQFQGTWTLESLEANGKKIDGEIMKKAGQQINLVVKGDQVTLKVSRGDLTGTIKLDPSKSPKAYEVKGAGPEGIAYDSFGIYKIDGDTLTVCYAAAAKDRPSEFKADAGSDVALQVWKRDKK